MSYLPNLRCHFCHAAQLLPLTTSAPAGNKGEARQFTCQITCAVCQARGPVVTSAIDDDLLVKAAVRVFNFRHGGSKNDNGR